MEKDREVTAVLQSGYMHNCTYLGNTKMNKALDDNRREEGWYLVSTTNDFGNTILYWSGHQWWGYIRPSGAVIGPGAEVRRVLSERIEIKMLPEPREVGYYLVRINRYSDPVLRWWDGVEWRAESSGGCHAVNKITYAWIGPRIEVPDLP